MCLTNPKEVQSGTKFLNGVICGLSDRWETEEAERSHRSEATKLSGARMPKQRWASYSQPAHRWSNKVHTMRPLTSQQNRAAQEKWLEAGSTAFAALEVNI